MRRTPLETRIPKPKLAFETRNWKPEIRTYSPTNQSIASSRVWNVEKSRCENVLKFS